MPQKAPGRMTEPTVCVPSAAGTIPQPTAAAEPEEEPPGVCSGLCGLRVLPGVKVASSVVTVLPMMTAPARRSAVTQAASVVGWRPLWARQPFSVGQSAVSMMSLMPMGTPCSGPTPLPSRRCVSAARACVSARSGSRNCQACTRGLEDGDALETGGDERLARELAAGDALGCLGGGEVGEAGIGQGRLSVGLRSAHQARRLAAGATTIASARQFGQRRLRRRVAALSRRRGSWAATASCRARNT